MTGQAAANTDREVWREKPGDFYSPSIHVTQEGGIGIHVHGTVFVMDIRDWHRLAASTYEIDMKKLQADGEKADKS